MYSPVYYIRSYLSVMTVVILTTTTSLALIVSAENFTIGYLATDNRSSIQQRQARVISGAITYALSQINEDPNLLAGHYLEVIYEDTQADVLRGLRILSELWRKNVVAFFGPEDTCDVEGKVAAAWNLPIFSYVRSLFHLPVFSSIPSLFNVPIFSYARTLSYSSLSPFFSTWSLFKSVLCAAVQAIDMTSKLIYHDDIYWFLGEQM